MATDAKGRPLIPWIKVDYSAIQLISEGEAVQMQKAVKAALANYETGVEAELTGYEGIVYRSLTRTIEESAELVEKKRIGGQKGGLVSAQKRNGQGVLEESSTDKITEEKIIPEKIIPEEIIPDRGTHERRNPKTPKRSKQSFSNQRVYDYDSLEQSLLDKQKQR